MHIGILLAEQRKKLNISQNALSKRINVAQSTISYIESGDTNPAFDIVEKIIVDGFNMSLQSFFSGQSLSIENYAEKELINSAQNLPLDKISLLSELAKAMKN